MHHYAPEATPLIPHFMDQLFIPKFSRCMAYSWSLHGMHHRQLVYYK